MSRTPLVRQTAPLPVADDDLFDRPPARRRRRVLIAMSHLLLAAAVVFVGVLVRGGDDDRMVVPPAIAGSVSLAPTASPAPSGSPSALPKNATKAAGTSGKFTFVANGGAVLGRAGPIHRFHVAVELPAGAGATENFGTEIDRTLGDRRSWIAAGRFRLQRVPLATRAEFTIYLASARTSERMCRTGGLETGAYTSCRLPGKVIINDDRWEGAIRDYGAPIGTYRAYAINHEVGHQLGHGHEACPGKGRPAPVMMQQTFGLKGCVANSWPYVGGRRYTGPPAR
jgi:hypothetical protein